MIVYVKTLQLNATFIFIVHKHFLQIEAFPWRGRGAQQPRGPLGCVLALRAGFTAQPRTHEPVLCGEWSVIMDELESETGDEKNREHMKTFVSIFFSS